MNITFEYAESVGICVLRFDHYGSGLDQFMELFRVAEIDFPELRWPDVCIVQFGGRTYKRTFGIEFKPKANVPEKYERIAKLEWRI